MNAFRNVTCAAVLCAGSASAGNPVIQFASPVAAQSYQMKKSAFVFRAVGCSAGALAEVSATAEGKVDGQRRSVPLKIATASAPNVFGIFRDWPNTGVWVVSIRARCDAKTAGALVATDSIGLLRESSSALDHEATEAEIEAALSRGKKPEGRID